MWKIIISVYLLDNPVAAYILPWRVGLIKCTKACLEFLMSISLADRAEFFATSAINIIRHIPWIAGWIFSWVLHDVVPTSAQTVFLHRLSMGWVLVLDLWSSPYLSMTTHRGQAAHLVYRASGKATRSYNTPASHCILFPRLIFFLKSGSWRIYCFGTQLDAKIHNSTICRERFG